MKNLELEGFGLVEMKHEELINTDGGGIFGALIGFVVGAAIVLFSEGQLTDDNGWFAVALIGAAIGSTLPI